MPIVLWSLTTTQSFTTTELLSRSVESRIETRTLFVATSTLNLRIRCRGLSAREMWTKRDQFSNIQIPLSDYDLISQQDCLRKANHPSSEKSKASLAQVASSSSVAIGDLVYLYCD